MRRDRRWPIKGMSSHQCSPWAMEFPPGNSGNQHGRVSVTLPPEEGRGLLNLRSCLSLVKSCFEVGVSMNSPAFPAK